LSFLKGARLGGEKKKEKVAARGDIDILNREIRASHSLRKEREERFQSAGGGSISARWGGKGKGEQRHRAPKKPTLAAGGAISNSQYAVEDSKQKKEGRESIRTTEFGHGGGGGEKCNKKRF